MRLEDAKAIVDFLGENIAHLYEGYSGRGMGGKETAGVVTDSVFDVGVAVGALNLDIEGVRTDNMGRNLIVY